MTNNTPDYEDNLYFDCKNCKMTDEYCASGDCPNDNTLTEQYKSINESLNEYVKANVELATWMFEKENAELKKVLKEIRSDLIFTPRKVFSMEYKWIEDTVHKINEVVEDESD